MASTSKRPFEEREEEKEDDGSVVQSAKRVRFCNPSCREVISTMLFSKPHRLMLETLLRGMVQEGVQAAFANCKYSASRALHTQEVVRFQLHFPKKLPHTLFTGGIIKVGDGLPVEIVLKDTDLDKIVESGCLASIRIKLVVLDGDFRGDGEEGWTEEDFKKKIVATGNDSRQLLKGETIIRLQKGVGFFTNATFTDISRTRTGKFRLGALVCDSRFTEGRVREAISEAFKVKDRRGESNQKDRPPSMNDEVWHLKNIRKNGALQRKLEKDGITTVQDFLRSSAENPERLRDLLARGMSLKKWKETLKHASECTSESNSIVKHRGPKIAGLNHPRDEHTASQDLVNNIREQLCKNPRDIVEFQGIQIASLPRPLTTVGVSSIPGSSISNEPTPKLQVSFRDEPSNQVDFLPQPYVPCNELSTGLSQPRDIYIGNSFESVQQFASVHIQEGFKDIYTGESCQSIQQFASVDIPESFKFSVVNDTWASPPMPLLPANATPISGLSTSQIPPLPASYHDEAAAKVGFQYHEPGVPGVIPYISAGQGDPYSASFPTNSHSTEAGEDIFEEVMEWIKEPSSPATRGGPSTSYASGLPDFSSTARLSPRRWVQLIAALLRWVSINKRPGSRRAGIVHPTHQTLASEWTSRCM